MIREVNICRPVYIMSLYLLVSYSPYRFNPHLTYYGYLSSLLSLRLDNLVKLYQFWVWGHWLLWWDSGLRPS